MKNWSKKFGFVSIEAIIVASIILGIGILGVMSLGSTGSKVVSNGLDKLDSLNLFNNNGSVVDKYDENGYLKTLNVNPADINPESDFVFQWNEELNGWEIVDFVWNNNDLVIPSKLSDGLPVVKISNPGYEFEEWNDISNVIIPNGIKVIGENAFENQGLTEIHLPDSLVEIGDDAFVGNELISLTIPNNVKEVGFRTFWGNPLTSVVLSDSLEIIGESAFYGHQLTSLTIPNSVKEIEQGAFSGNTLTSITLSESLNILGDGAFYGNPLTAITFNGPKPTVIGDYIVDTVEGEAPVILYVPNAYLTDYQSVASKFNATSSDVIGY